MIEKGLQLYDNFTPSDKFSLAITISIDEIQYWRDNPIFLGYVDPALSDMVNYEDQINEVAAGIGADSYLDQVEKIKEEYDKYKNLGDSIIEDIKKISYINDGEAMDIDIPTPESAPTEIKIYDDNGNVVKTIPVDMGKREYKTTDNGIQAITILDSIPEDFTDDQLPDEADETLITTLPDSYIKDKLWIASNEINAKVVELNDSSSDLIDAINVIPNEVELPDETLPDTINDSLTKKIEMWYGIPLVNLSANDTPIKEAFILQLNTRDWSLNITNIARYSLTDLKIDGIPPNKRFSVGLTYSHPKVTLYLKIEGDPTLYENSVVLTEEIDLSMVSVGVDSVGLKTLCGTVYNMKYWENGTYPTLEPLPQLPRYPRDGWVYSGQPGWTSTNDNDFYPIGNWTKPAWNGGKWWEKDGWRFILDGYLDRLFCRYNIVNTSFSIVWYQYQIGYPTGIRTFISDPLHSNYIRYDYDNFQLIIDFNGKHYVEYITLPEFMWSQFSLRFDIETNKIVFQFRDFFHDRIEEISLDLGEGLEFELLSLFGRFDRKTNQYVEVQEGVFGLIIVDKYYYSDEELDAFYNDHKSFLNTFNPRWIRSSLPQQELFQGE